MNRDDQREDETIPLPGGPGRPLPPPEVVPARRRSPSEPTTAPLARTQSNETTTSPLASSQATDETIVAMPDRVRRLAYLVELSGIRAPRVYPLGSETVIGRDPGLGTIVVQDPKVSRLHAKVKLSDDGFSLYDLGSTNGTFVTTADGRQRVTEPRKLADRDIVAVGRQRFVFLDVPPELLAEYED